MYGCFIILGGVEQGGCVDKGDGTYNDLFMLVFIFLIPTGLSTFICRELTYSQGCQPYPHTDKLNQTPKTILSFICCILVGTTTSRLQVSQHRPSLTGSALLPLSHPVTLQGEIGESHIEQSIDYTSVVYL